MVLKPLASHISLAEHFRTRIIAHPDARQCLLFMLKTVNNPPDPSVPDTSVLLYRDCEQAALAALLGKFGLEISCSEPGEPIPGSFWGDEEAGLLDTRVLTREDTPVHSVLHEGCHFICMDGQRRNALNTNAGGDYDEENAVCYLQVLLADLLPDMDRMKMFEDMDAWGYSFRLGSARAWFESDAEDAKAWLIRHGIIDDSCRVNYQLRK